MGGNTCVNKLCLDVCHPGLCGENADCRTQSHRPVCACPPGTAGNPTLKCSAIATERPPTPMPPIGEHQPPPPGQPVAGQAESTTHPGPLSVTPITAQTPIIPRPIPPPIVPPFEIACENNDDCNIDNSCINLLCYDVCGLGICGEDADCKTLNHRPVCVCPPGTTGNPQVKCTSLEGATTPSVIPIAQTTPPADQPIISGETKTTARPPLSETQRPIEKEPEV